MKNKKILISLAGLAVVGGSIMLGMGSTEQNIFTLGAKRNYIVSFKDFSSYNEGAFEAKLSELVGAGNYKINATYSGDLFNGVALTVHSGYKDIIESWSFVTGVFNDTVYSLPTSLEQKDSVTAVAAATNVDTSKTTTSYSRATMKIEDSSQNIAAPKKQGLGTVIGILDTGLFYNQVASSASDNSTKAFRPLAVDDESAELGVKLSSAKQLAQQVGSDGQHTGAPKVANNKIIWSYDYADNDNIVSPSFSNSHGTHVASLAAANGATYEGTAPDAQVAIFKVFSDASSGATTSSILKAIQDIDKMDFIDSINLSLGSALFQMGNDAEDFNIYSIVKKLENRGVQVNFAAGNDGRAEYNKTTGFFADFLTTDTVEPSELGSYALLDNANIIASSYLDKTYKKKLIINGNADTGAVDFTDQNSDYPIANLFDGGSDVKLRYLYIGGAGTGEWYDSNPNVDAASQKIKDYAIVPTIAVVNRGGALLGELSETAQKYGAKAVIIINNSEVQDNSLGRFDLSSASTPVTIPVVSAYFRDIRKFGEAGSATGEISYEATGKLEENEAAKQMSYFSSDGPATNLAFNPDITAPGTDILGAVNGAYETMSGTSMASPNFTGAMATILSNHLGDAEYNKHLMARIQSTATPLRDDSKYQIDFAHDKNGKWSASSVEKFGELDIDNYASPRRAGAGMINVSRVLNDKVWLETPVTDENKNPVQANNKYEGSGKAKLQMGYTDGDFSKGIFKAPILIHNEDTVEKNYQVSLYVAVPEVRPGADSSELSDLGVSSSNLAKGLTTTDLMSTDDHMVANIVLNENLTVPAGDSIYSIDVDINAKTNNALEDYVKKYFQYGTFLEGYVLLQPTDQKPSADDTAEQRAAKEQKWLRMPYLGFYGDYSTAPAVEDFDFQRTSDNTLNSDIQQQVARNIVGGSQTADFSSQIFGASLAKYTSSNNYNTALSALDELYRGDKTLADVEFAKLGTDPNNEAYDPNNRNKIVGGVKNFSDLLVIKQFVNRSLYSGKVTLTDSNGTELNSSWLQDHAYTGLSESGTLNNPIQNSDGSYQLLKSFLSSSLITARYYVPLASTAIPLKDSQGKDLDPGTYKLRFDYVLMAKKDGSNPANDFNDDGTPVEIPADQRITQQKEIEIEIPSADQISKPAVYSYGRVGTEFVIYVPDDTKYVRFGKLDEETSDVRTATTPQGQTYHYVSVPAGRIVNGVLKGTAVGLDGKATSFIIDSKGEGQSAIYGRESNLTQVEIFYFTASLNAENRTLTYTATALSSRNETVRQFFQDRTHGFTFNVAKDPSNQAFKFTAVKGLNLRGNEVDISSSYYEYDESTGQFTILDLPANVASIQFTF